MFNFSNKEDLKYSVSHYHVDTENNCDEHGCHDEGICRCGRIVDVTFDVGFVPANSFFTGIFDGGKGIDKALAHWFVRKHFNDLTWGYTSGGGYYGDELESIFIRDDNDFYHKAMTFSDMSNKERVEFMLTKEYGRVLPSVTKVKDWTMQAVFVADVMNSANTNLDTRTLRDYTEYCNELALMKHSRDMFQEHTQILAPLTIKNGMGKYQVIDGRHRTTALTQEYKYKEQIEGVSKKGNPNKKWTEQVFTPVYMWIICPVEEHTK